MLSTSAELEELIDSTVNIPTIPTILTEITNVFNSPDGSAKEAAAIIEKDPAIASKVLRLANSSFYGLKNPVSSINLACSILGLKVIKNLVVQATVLDTFSGVPEIVELDVTWLWSHAFKTAVACRLLVQHGRADAGLSKDDAYTCGLIHDVGKLILLDSQTERLAEALRFSKQSRLPLAKAEGELFGFNHAHVGGLLAGRWKLPEAVQAAVMYHHSPATNPEDWARGFIVKAANTLAHRAATGCHYLPDMCTDDEMLVLGLDDAKLKQVMAQVDLATQG